MNVSGLTTILRKKKRWCRVPGTRRRTEGRVMGGSYRQGRGDDKMVQRPAAGRTAVLQRREAGAQRPPEQPDDEPERPAEPGPDPRPPPQRQVGRQVPELESQEGEESPRRRELDD